MTKDAYFNMPAHGKGGVDRIELPQQITLEATQENRTLTFSDPKTLGSCIGGFYEDDDGQKYMVKIGYSYRLENSDPQKFYSSHLGNRYEALVNDLARMVLDEGSTPDTQLGRYEKDGVSFPCFISKEVVGYRDISHKDFSAEDKKHLRLKFHPDYVFNALITNDDIHDDNLGTDHAGHGVNIDYGTFPSFIERNQEPCKNIVHQVASFIGHQSIVGKQITKKRFFGYDKQVNPLDFEPEEIKDNDISYYEVVLGARTICEKRDQLKFRTESELEAIAQDNTIPEHTKTELLSVFTDISRTLEQRVNYLQEHFGPDFADLEANAEKFKSSKWRHSEKFKEIFEQHRQIDAQISQQCYHEQFTQIAQIISDGSSPQDFRSEILATDFSQLPSNKQDQIKEFAANKFLLHCAVVNNDLEVTKWLLNNEISDINDAYRQRDYGYQYHMMSALSTAISMHNDAMVYDKNYHLCDDMIAFLNEKFEQRNPQSLEADYVNRTDLSFVLTRSKLAFNKYEEAGEKIKAGDAIAHQAKTYITAKNCTKLSSNEVTNNPQL